MPSKSTPSKDINELNDTISKLREEVDSLRNTGNMLLEIIIEQDDGEYEEGAPTNQWEALVSNPQGFLRMGM